MNKFTLFAALIVTSACSLTSSCNSEHQSSTIIDYTQTDDQLLSQINTLFPVGMTPEEIRSQLQSMDFEVGEFRSSSPNASNYMITGSRDYGQDNLYIGISIAFHNEKADGTNSFTRTIR